MKKKSLRFLVLAFFLSFNPCKPSQPENNLPAALALGGAVVAGTFAYKFISHGVQLYQIQQMLKNAMVEATNTGTNFSFATWQRSTWLTGSDLLQHKTQAYERLKREATKLTDKVFMYDAAGTRIAPERVRMLDVQKALAAEKGRYENLLEFVGSLTDASSQLVQLSIEHGYCDVHGYVRVYDNQQALINATKLTKLTEHELQDFGHQLHDRCQPGVMRWVMCFPSYDPRTWSAAPWYPWAAQLYWFLYKNYIRLLTLKSIVDEHIVGKANTENFVLKQLRLLRDAVVVMRVCQPTAHTNDYERSKQHAQVFKFNEDLKALISRLQTHHEHKALIHPLNTLARYIPTIQQQLKMNFDEGKDPVVDMLETIDTELERLIELQEKE